MLSGDLRSALHAARTMQRLRYTAIAAKVRVNGVFMTITYFVKNNRNSLRPARAAVRRLDNLLRKIRNGLMPPGELSGRKVTRQKMS